MYMNDWGKSVLEQYDLEVNSVSRGRGSLLCDTSQGLKQLLECTWGSNRLEREAQILNFLKEEGGQQVDAYVRNKEGCFYSENSQQVKYVLKDWYRAGECNVNSVIELGMAVRNLAKLHALLRQFAVYEREQQKEGVEGELSWDLLNWKGSYLPHEYTRRNNELRRVRTYIRNKKKKSDFERDIFSHISDIIEQGEEAKLLLEEANYQELYEQAINQHYLCHGNCSQHNLLLKDGSVMIVNFQKAKFMPQVTDLYFFMRKVLEKNHYSIRVGRTMLEDYNRILPLSQNEWAVLKAMFTFPEKYWKQMNYYLNNNKTWISPRSVEKLEKATRQLACRKEFIQAVF
ncbi:MAG: hypothetical protein ACI4C1_09040 [Lachnospiraceae bacterium]